MSTCPPASPSTSYPNFPAVFGSGTTGDTHINAVAVKSTTLDMAIGGYSLDTSIFPALTGAVPFIISYDTNMAVKWKMRVGTNIVN